MIVGLGIGVGFQRVSGGGGTIFDPDYQAVLNYATSLGYTLPSAAQQIKQNQLMLSLKAAGVWSKLDTFAVFANDGSSNFGLIDWKRLSLYTAVNSPTFTSNVGFQGNGTSSYINSNFNTALGATRQNNASMGARYSIPATYIAFHNEVRSNITQSAGANTALYNSSSVTHTPSSWNISSGCNSIIRDSIGMYVYDNTSLKSTVTGYNTANGGLFQILRAVNGSIYSIAQVNVAYFAQAFTSTEIINFHSAINTYYNSL